MGGRYGSFKILTNHRAGYFCSTTLAVRLSQSQASMEQSADSSTAFKENLLILQGSRNMELLSKKVKKLNEILRKYLVNLS